MSLHNYIKSVTQLDKNKQITTNIVWSKVLEKENCDKPPHAKGEIPYDLDEYHKHFHSNSAQVNKNLINKKEIPKIDTKIPPKPSNFLEIESSLRMINQYGCQSNEIIERCHKERQKKLLMDNNTIKNEDLHKKGTNKNSEHTDWKRYKRNALMTGLLQKIENYSLDIEDSVTASSKEFLDSSESNIGERDIITNLKIDREIMRKEQLDRFLKSEVDQDVYIHPLVEQIKKDPEWKNLVLRRKGIETITTSRQYFMNIDNSSFTFQPNISK